MSYGAEAEGFPVGSGHTVWEVADHEVTEIRRLALVSGPDGLSTTESGDPAHQTPPLPAEVQARPDSALESATD